MEKKLIEGIILIVLLISIIAFLGFFASKKPTITGIVIYEETINTLNWTFDDLNDFSYDSSLINLSDGEAKLVRTIVEHTWSVENLTEVYVISAVEYEPGKEIHDRTTKVQSLDDDKVNINKDKEIFDVTFDKELANNDIISMYILESDNNTGDVNIDVYLCDNGTFCNETNYGLVNFNGEGWHNITITGLDEPKNIFNINPSKNIKFDYIKAVHIDITTHSSENISYPASASIETNDIDIAGLSSFLNFYKNDLLNNQNIDYYYSIDSGDNWYALPDDGDLSSIDITNQKIMIKAEFSSDGSATPVIYDFSVRYERQICNENWNITYGSCLPNNTILKYYIDKNDCGTTNNLPADNGTYESCNYGSETLNTTKFLIDAKQESNVLLEIKTKSGVSNVSISIVKYSTNLKNSTPSLKELGKYIDIVADNATKQNLSSITIKIYYTDEEITNANLDEESLKIHYFNETSNQWQILNSTVNTSGNYVEVTIDHLSTFGIFGEEKISEGSGSSSSSGSGGGSTRRIPKTVTKPVETETLLKKEEIIKEEKVEETEEECDYKISVSLPEHVSLVEADYVKGTINNIGNCRIENINIGISAELKGLIKIENKKIENIEVNGSVEFLLLKKLETGKVRNLIQGFNIKIPKNNIKTYNGSLILGAVVQEQLAFEERINIKVDLSKPVSTIEIIKLNIPLLSIIFLIFLGLFSMYYKKREKNKIKEPN